MHIAMVSDRDPALRPGDKGHGGRSRHTRGLADALATAGHDVHVWVRRTHPDLIATETLPGGATVHRLDAGRAAPLSDEDEFAKVQAWTRALDAAWTTGRAPDVVHALGLTAGLAAVDPAATRDIPMVQSIHGAPREPGHTRTPAELRLGAAAAAVIVTSSEELDRLARLGVDRRRLHVVPTAVDDTEFTPHGPRLRRAEHPRLVAVGGLDRASGVPGLLAALASVPRAELLVAGGPPTGTGTAPGRDDALRAAHRVADDHGVARRVRFLGAVRREHLPALYRSADVVVHVPHRSTFGTPVLEAMASGRAVVASDVGSVRDAVVDEVTGFLVPPARPDLLARALRRLLSATTLLEAYGVAGHDRALSRYTWPRVAEQFGAIFGSVVRQPEPVVLSERTVVPGDPATV